jgi:hypothetical protein
LAIRSTVTPLDLDIPAGWTAELTRLGQPVSQVDLPALLFNSVELRLLVTPDASAAAGQLPDYGHGRFVEP